MAQVQHEYSRCLSIVCFFFDCFNQICSEYTGLFGDGGGDGANIFGIRWGWYIVVDEMANNDVTKHKDITQMNVYKFLNHMAYLIEKKDNGTNSK